MPDEICPFRRVISQPVEVMKEGQNQLAVPQRQVVQT